MFFIIINNKEDIELKKQIILTVLSCLVLCLFAVTGQAASSSKNIVAYYPNWGVYGENNQNMKVDQLPWDKVTYINHAFWMVADDYTLVSTDEWADLQMDMGYTAKLPDGSEYKGHFAAYKAMHEKYPNVNILISVGGWTKCHNFSAMASTKEHRAIFINSCIQTLKKYPFIAGIDLDWEYPGQGRLGDSDDPNDFGCPGTEKDKANFTVLLKELRQAMNKNGMQNAKITICEQANVANSIKNQELKKIAKVVDMVNVMTYDYDGSWSKKTGALSPLKSDALNTAKSMEEYSKYFNKKQLNVGTPLYSRGWGQVEMVNGTALGQMSGAPDTASVRVCGIQDQVKGTYGVYTSQWDSTGKAKLVREPELLGKEYGVYPGGQNPWFLLKKWEKSPQDGWIAGFDERTVSAWLYNSKTKEFYSYENERSLQAKLDFVNQNNYGGMIVWCVTGDIKGEYPMFTQMAKAMFK